MEDLEEVRRRMAARKQAPVLTDRSFQKFYRMATTTMVAIALLIGTGCFLKQYPENEVKDWLDQHVLSLIPLPSFLKSQEVSQQVFYEEIESGVFMSSDHNICALQDGIVTSASEKEITIVYQNGITATYKNLATNLVKLYDRLEQGEIIATYEQAFQLSCLKDGSTISYHDAFN